MEQKYKGLLGYFLSELFEPSENRLLSRSATNEGCLFRGSLNQKHALAQQKGVTLKVQLDDLSQFALSDEALDHALQTNATSTKDALGNL